MKRKLDSKDSKNTKRRREDRHISKYNFKSMPLFFNLVDSITIVSHHAIPFTCHLSSLAESYGLNAFTRGNTIKLSETGDERLDLERKCASFYSSLCYYKHPQPLPKIIVSQIQQLSGDTSNLHLQGDLGEFIQERIAKWTQAFTSLYSMLRNGKCPYFYLRVPKMNSVVFIAHGVGGKDIRAIWNHPSSKNKLDLQKYSIQFTEILQSNGGSGNGIGSMDGIGGTMSGTGAGSTGGENIQPLLFSGKKDVHALFNFLLIEACGIGLKWLREDVPELISSTPFIFGTLENVEVKQAREHSNTGSSIIRKEQSRDESDVEKKYVLHLSGIFLPHTIQHMVRVFESSFPVAQNRLDISASQVTFNFRIIPETRYFNCVKLTNTLSSSFPFSKIIAQEASELEYEFLDQEQLNELNNNVVKSVTMIKSSKNKDYIYETNISDAL